jgi:ATP-dependent RNA helicase RhlE
MSFKDLSLLAELMRAIDEKGYTDATSIQMQVIPIIIEGHDLLAGAQTGTGKTAGFTLPVLQNLMKKGKTKGPRLVRSLILTPTRELAMQVEESVKTFSKHLPLKSTVVFGGVNIYAQKRQLAQGVDILVATPGRLLDLVGQQAVDLSHVESFVLDEADCMLDMGFIQDIRKIITLLPKKRQNLLFSATFSPKLKHLAGDVLVSPKLIQETTMNTATDSVIQTVHPVDSKRKRELLIHLIRTQSWPQVLVFTCTKHGAHRLSMQLVAEGITATAIHGGKTQGARMKALSDFKRGVVRVLVATDVAARGLDIHQLPYVVNFDLPSTPEDYVHRIGRTGRAGHKGEAISLMGNDEHRLLRHIERQLKQEITKVIIPEYQPEPGMQAESFNHFNQKRKPFKSPKRYNEKQPPVKKEKFTAHRTAKKFNRLNVK